MIMIAMKTTMTSSYFNSHDNDGYEDDHVKFLIGLPW